MIKAHLFYLDNYIYAFTATKELAKKFRMQRCMDTLKYRVEKMEDNQWSIFSNKHNSSMLIDNPYDSKSGTVSLITTYGEEEAISSFIASLESSKEEAFSSLLDRIGFNEKIDRILREGLGLIYSKDSGGGICLNLNALEIAIYLFEPTFTGEGEIKVPRTVDFTLTTK